MLGFGEEVIHPPVEDHASDDFDRHLLFGDELGGVEDVEFEPLGERFVEELDAKFPFGEVAGFDGRPEVAAMEIGVGPVNLDRLVPND